jgi:hypothetical protein
VARVKGNDPAAVPAPDPHDPLLTALQGRQERGFRMNLEEAFETRSPSHARTMLLLSVFPIAFWLFVGWLGMHPRLARRSRSVLLVLVLALPIVVVVATEFVALSSGYASAPASILAAVVTRRVGELLPLATGVLVAGVSFMGVGVYLVLGRAFERFEAPRQTAKACAMGWRSSNS